MPRSSNRDAVLLSVAVEGLLALAGGRPFAASLTADEWERAEQLVDDADRLELSGDDEQDAAALVEALS